MDNLDILIRLRYALDIKDIDMVKIFKLGGAAYTVAEMKQMLAKKDPAEAGEDRVSCSNDTLAAFLNGLIVFKRGKQEPQPGQGAKPVPALPEGEPINNTLLKKVKIALELTGDDINEIFKSTGLPVTKGELSALFRKAGHKNYKACGDKYARTFLKGLTIRYRG